MSNKRSDVLEQYLGMSMFKTNMTINKWVLVNLTGKVSDGCIRDLRFNPRLHQKLIGVLIDDKKLLSRADTIG